MAYEGNWSISERRAVEELKKRMENKISSETFECLGGDDCVFYRFLKARNFDVTKAEDMLKKHLIWRKAFQINKYAEEFEPQEFFKKYIEPSELGFDKEGDLILYFPSGHIEGKDVLRCSKINDYMKNWRWYAEKITGLIKQRKLKIGKVHMQLTVILDLNDLTLINAICPKSRELCLRIVHEMTDNYPELIKTVYMINAPSYYVIIFSIVKSMMSSELLKKFHIYGCDGWKEKLRGIADADTLPAFLGGNRTDPDGNPMCTSFVKLGGKMPEMYHLSDEERLFEDMTQVKKLTVPQSEKKEIYADVEESGSLIHWEFLIHNNKNVRFGLFMEDPEQQCEMEEILPIQVYETVDGTEVGRYKADSEGRYIIVFDNTYSWRTPKEIEYCIKVIKPSNP